MINFIIDYEVHDLYSLKDFFWNDRNIVFLLAVFNYSRNMCQFFAKKGRDNAPGGPKRNPDSHQVA